MKAFISVEGGGYMPVSVRFGCEICGIDLEKVLNKWKYFHPFETGIFKKKIIACPNAGKSYAYPKVELKELS